MSPEDMAELARDACETTSLSTAVLVGDCLDVLWGIPDQSVDAIVTDPPYGLEFMGREWDGANGFRRSLNAADVGRDSVFGRTSRTSPEYRTDSVFQQWCQAWATECLRILKPGGHLLAFGGSRTWHRLASGIEDAGFEMRDSIAWLYGSGFPKSMDVSKAIDKAAGAEREGAKHSGFSPFGAGTPRCLTCGRSKGSQPGNCRCVDDKQPPATPDAERWQGWGTALKPAFEPIVVARKPLAGTVAANVLEHGTGALNIDSCRIETPGGSPSAQRRLSSSGDNGATAADSTARGEMRTRTSQERFQEQRAGEQIGRWPANVVLDEHTSELVDEQSGTRRGMTRGVLRRGATTGRSIGGDSSFGQAGPQDAVAGYGDTGGASRFFYCAKAPKRERPRVDGVNHPTVKPLTLMCWLVRLVTPPGGTVLDPFAGSGTTVEAAMLEGFNVIAIEREDEYLPLIEQRIARLDLIG